MSKPDVLADLRGVVRIAKAASLGVTGNQPRIAKAEAAIAAVAELIEAARKINGIKQHNGILVSFDGIADLAIALARVGGAP